MGQTNSLPVVEGFSREEVSRLEKRFQKLDLDHSGTISVGEFLSIPELKENPLVKRVVDIFDEDLSGEVDFKEFVLGLARFGEKEVDTEKKLQFLFRVYDLDRDGYISNGELFQVLKMMTGKNLSDLQLQQIVDRTILYLDKDEDGRISYEEFKLLVERTASLSQVATSMAVSV